MADEQETTQDGGAVVVPTVQYKIQTVCECQSILEADLDHNRQVLAGWVKRGGSLEKAPANAVGADGDRFDVVWQCPMCNRNTLRTFYAGALQRVAPKPPPSEDSAA